MKLLRILAGIGLVGLLGILGISAQQVTGSSDAPAGPRPPEAARLAPQASVLRLIRFSGQLKAAETTLPVGGWSRTAPVGITFALYADQEGGTPLWLETQNVEVDPEGRYTALLGVTSAEGLPLELFTSGEARWLEITGRGRLRHVVGQVVRNRGRRK